MSVPTCGHRKADGVLCGSPAPRGQKLCYFNQREPQRAQQHARVRRRADDLHFHFPPLDSAQNIQIALFDVLDSLAADSIEPRRASALLFALQQASLHFRPSKAA